MIDYGRTLRFAIDIAVEAGALFRDAFFQRGGPPGDSGKSPIDVDAERLLRARIEANFPTHGIRAEELPALDRLPARGEEHFWLIDPNDGTRGYLSGFRESTVSIALIRGDEPVLGVILAPCLPLGRADLFSWALGEPLMRNGERLAPLRDAPYDSHTRLAISHNADFAPFENSMSVAPARYLSIPSLAYRIALAAAGEVDASVSIKGPRDFDFAAGHALIIGAGGLIVDENGDPLRYRPEVMQRAEFCFAGRPTVVRELLRRDFKRVNLAPEEHLPAHGLIRPRRGENEPEATIYDRALGAIYGLFIGDAMGSPYEGMPPSAISELPDELIGSSLHHTIAGQPTDDGEMALAMTRSLCATGRFDERSIASSYARWYESGPFSIGYTTTMALRAASEAEEAGEDPLQAMASAGVKESQANGALMRAAPIALSFLYQPAEALEDAAKRDAALTHPNAACLDANAIYLQTLAALIRDEASPSALYREARALASKGRFSPLVGDILDEAAKGPPIDALTNMGWLRHALQFAYHSLLNAEDFMSGIHAVIRGGGDTDTNAAIAGAMLGARFGASSIPASLRNEIRSARAIRGVDFVETPRPIQYWPVDLEALTERLLGLSRSGAILGQKS